MAVEIEIEIELGESMKMVLKEVVRADDGAETSSCRAMYLNEN